MIDLTKEQVVKIPPSLTHQEMVDNYNNNVSIHGFFGGVSVEPSVLDQEVPEIFPSSTKTIGDGDEVRVVQKTWREYSRWWENESSALLLVGYRDANGNRRDVVDNLEFRLWADHFGIDNLLTKSEFIAEKEQYISEL